MFISTKSTKIKKNVYVKKMFPLLSLLPSPSHAVMLAVTFVLI